MSWRKRASMVAWAAIGWRLPRRAHKQYGMPRWTILLTALFALACTPTRIDPLPPTEPPAAGESYGPPIDPMLEEHVVRVLQAEMRRCWRMPTDLPNPDRLVVTLLFELNQDGTLRGAPRIIHPRNYRSDADYRTAVERALRAVRRCAPYPFPEDPIVRDHYEAWREIEMTFAARPNPASR